jgi:peptidoglycan LD-endopeptidase LytH
MLRRLVVALVALALAGCSGGGEPTAAPATVGGAGPSSTVAPSTASTAATASTVKRRPLPSSTRGAPVAGRYVFPVQGCRVSYGRSHHDYPATDIFAARGCAFVAPVDGVVDEVGRRDVWDPATNRGADRGGRFVSVVGVDQVRYYGSHLGSVAPEIAPGVKVRAGQLLGRVDSSGNAEGISPHLHFGLSWPTRPGIWWIRRGVVYPWPYLDAWRAGTNRSPAPAVRTARAAAGSDVPPCRAGC